MIKESRPHPKCSKTSPASSSDLKKEKVERGGAVSMDIKKKTRRIKRESNIFTI